MRVELFKGKGVQPWFLRLVGANNKVLAVSEGYFSHRNAVRAARKNYPRIPFRDTTTPKLPNGHVGPSQVSEDVE